MKRGTLGYVKGYLRLSESLPHKASQAPKKVLEKLSKKFR